MATHSSTLAWKILWMEKPGGLQSMGSQRIRHDWATHTFLHTMYTILYTLHTVLVKVTQSCPTLCSHVDCSPPRSSVHGILQARILEWIAISFSRRSSRPRDQTQVSCIAGRFFTLWATRKDWVLNLIWLVSLQEEENMWQQRQIEVLQLQAKECQKSSVNHQ